MLRTGRWFELANNILRAQILRTHAAAATRAGLLAPFSDAFARRFTEWSGGRGEAHFAAWERRAHGIGASVRVKLPSGEVAGFFRGLDHGRLVLDTSEGRRVLDAGDLYVLNVGEEKRRAGTP